MQVFRSLQLPAFAVLILTLVAGCGQNLVPVTVSLETSAQTVTEASTLTLTAKVEGSALAKVAFYDGTNKLGEDETAPYSFDVKLSSAENGEHTYRSVAMDGVNTPLAMSEKKVQINIAQSKTNPSEPIKILSISPADGSTGVKSDTRIVVTFSGPADKAAVEASYRSDFEGIKSGQVEFGWNEAGTVLTIQPNSVLEYATNELKPNLAGAPIPAAPDTVVAKKYTFVISGVSSSFATMREITILLRSGSAANWNSERPSDTHSRCLSWGGCFGDNEENKEIRSMIVFDPTLLKGRTIARVRFFGYVLGWPRYARGLDSCLPQQGEVSCKFINAELLDPHLVGEAGSNPETHYQSAFDAPSVLRHRLGVQTQFLGDNNQAFTDFLLEALRYNYDRMYIRLRLDMPTNNDGIADIGMLDMRSETRASLLVSYLD